MLQRKIENDQNNGIFRLQIANNYTHTKESLPV